MRKNRILKRFTHKAAGFFCVFMAIALIITPVMSVKGETVKHNNIPYTDFTYWQGYSSKLPIQTGAIFTPELAVDLTQYADSEKMELQHIVRDNYDNTYILDSGNGKIFVFDKNYQYVKTMTSVSNGKEEFSFVGARGLFFDDKNTLYIADTANKRVVCVYESGEIETILRPESSVIPKDYDFAPIRVVKDKNDFLYILCEGSYYGLLVLSNNNEMLGFFGASKVSVSVMDAITEWITSLFETQEKHEAGLKKLPYQISDITVSSSGFPVAVTTQSQGQIRLFSPTGSNILRTSNQFDTIDGDNYNFGDFPNSYAPVTSVYGVPNVQLFSGITADEDGYIYALDSTQGRIYMYDESCNLIGVFGGGIGKGNQVGTFVTPRSLVTNGEEIAVIDLVNKNLTVFKITDFGRKIKVAQNLTNDGDYTAAKPYWQEILGNDKNYQLAYIGLAKAALLEKDYESAMTYAKSGIDQKTYSQAYKFVRNEFVSNNLVWIVAIIVLLAASIVFVSIYIKKHKITFKGAEKLKVCSGTMLRPVVTYNDIAKRDLGSVKLSIGLLVLFYIATVSKRLFSNFSFNLTNVADFNAIYVLLGTVGTVLLYVVINWSVCTLLEGKGKFKKIFISSCYSLQPLIIYSFLFVILSYIVVPSGNSSLALIETIFTIIFVFWMLLSITIVHDFSFFKAIGAGLLVLLGMAISLFLIFIILTLGQDLIAFFVGIINEALLRR